MKRGGRTFRIDAVPTKQKVLDSLIEAKMAGTDMEGAVSIDVRYYHPNMRDRQEDVGGTERTWALEDAVARCIRNCFVVCADTHYLYAAGKDFVEVRVTPYGGAVPC